MSTVEEIKAAIETLGEAERESVALWLHGVEEREWAEWDARIAADAKAGKLDALMAKARADLRDGRTRELPTA